MGVSCSSALVIPLVAPFSSQFSLASSTSPGADAILSGVLIPNLSLRIQGCFSSNLKENSNDLENRLISLEGGEWVGTAVLGAVGCPTVSGFSVSSQSAVCELVTNL